MSGGAYGSAGGSWKKVAKSIISRRMLSSSWRRRKALAGGMALSLWRTALMSAYMMVRRKREINLVYDDMHNNMAQSSLPQHEEHSALPLRLHTRSTGLHTRHTFPAHTLDAQFPTRYYAHTCRLISIHTFLPRLGCLRCHVVVHPAHTHTTHTVCHTHHASYRAQCASRSIIGAIITLCCSVTADKHRACSHGAVSSRNSWWT